MKNLLIISIWLGFFHTGDDPFQFHLLKEIEIETSFFNSDEENNIYLVRDNQLLKYFPPYDKPISFDFHKHGTPECIDVTNPDFLVILFHESKKLIILNDSLNITVDPFYLNEAGLYDITSVVASTDKSLWFYSQYENVIVRLNENFIPVMRPLLLDHYNNNLNKPSYMTESGLYLFVGIPTEGVLVFNQLGEYITTLMIPGIVDFKLRKNKLMFYQDYCIHKYDLRDHTQQVIPLPGNLNIINAHDLGNAILIQTPDKIFIYENPGEKMIKKRMKDLSGTGESYIRL